MKNKVRHDKFMSFFSIASMILLFLIMFSALAYAMYRIDVIRLPDFIENILRKDDGESPEEHGDYDEELYETLRRLGRGNYTVTEYDPSESDVYEILKKSVSSAQYSAQLRTELISNEKTKTVNLEIIRDKERYRIDSYDADVLVSSVVCDGKKTEITDYVTFESKTRQIYPVTNTFDFEVQANMPRISDVFEEDRFRNVKISLLDTGEEKVYLVEYDLASDGSSYEKLYISLVNGLIIKAESYGKDGLYYRLTALSVSEGLPIGSDELFIIED